MTPRKLLREFDRVVPVEIQKQSTLPLSKPRSWQEMPVSVSSATSGVQYDTRQAIFSTPVLSAESISTRFTHPGVASSLAITDDPFAMSSSVSSIHSRSPDESSVGDESLDLSIIDSMDTADVSLLANEGPPEAFGGEPETDIQTSQRETADKIYPSLTVKDTAQFNSPANTQQPKQQPVSFSIKQLAKEVSRQSPPRTDSMLDTLSDTALKPTDIDKLLSELALLCENAATSSNSRNNDGSEASVTDPAAMQLYVTMRKLLFAIRVSIESHAIEKENIRKEIDSRSVKLKAEASAADAEAAILADQQREIAQQIRSEEESIALHEQHLQNLKLEEKALRGQASKNSQSAKHLASIEKDTLAQLAKERQLRERTVTFSQQLYAEMMELRRTFSFVFLLFVVSFTIMALATFMLAMSSDDGAR
eukprot:jgi/Hompol1/4074/HPOL_000905-RA